MFKYGVKVLTGCYEAMLELYNNNHFTNAYALAYTTLLSIIPLLSVIIYTGSLSSYFAEISLMAKSYIENNLLPSANQETINYLNVLSHQASTLPVISLIILFLTAVMFFMAIDRAMDLAWHQVARRKSAKRTLAYFLAVFSLPPVIALGSLLAWLMGYLLDSTTLLSLTRFIIPIVVNTVLLFIFYMVTSIKEVRWKVVLFSSLITAVLISFIKMLFKIYIVSFSSYQSMYGVLAVIPIFLIWVFLFWLAIIFGALLAKRV